MIEEIAKRQRSENCGKKNEPREYGQNKVIRQRSRYLKCVVAQNVAVSRAESLLDTADAHTLTIVSEAEIVNTEMTVFLRTRHESGRFFYSVV